MTKDDFNFAIFNVLLFDCYIPTAPTYGVYISQLIPYGRACSLYSDVLQRHRILRTKLLNPKCFFFQKISTPCWKVFCQLCTEDDRWYWQLGFSSKLVVVLLLCLTMVLYAI